VSCNAGVALIDFMALRADADNRYEIIKTGQARGDNGNWCFIISGSDLLLQVMDSDSWVTVWTYGTPA